MGYQASKELVSDPMLGAKKFVVRQLRTTPTPTQSRHIYMCVSAYSIHVPLILTASRLYADRTGGVGCFGNGFGGRWGTKGATSFASIFSGGTAVGICKRHFQHSGGGGWSSYLGDAACDVNIHIYNTSWLLVGLIGWDQLTQWCRVHRACVVMFFRCIGGNAGLFTAVHYPHKCTRNSSTMPNVHTPLLFNLPLNRASESYKPHTHCTS